MATIEPSRVVVCDAGPLIHLDELDCLDLLADFAALLVPDTVWEEVARHRPGALAGTRCPLTRRTAANPLKPELDIVARAFLLDAGERAALHVLDEEPGAILLTDDAGSCPSSALVINRAAVQIMRKWRRRDPPDWTAQFDRRARFS